MQFTLNIQSMTPYVIISKAETFALSSKQLYKQMFIVGDYVDPQNVAQLFFMQKTSTSNVYKIIHLCSDKLLTTKSTGLFLESDSFLDNQKYLLVQKQHISPYFWLQSVEEGHRAVSLEKTLQMLPFQSSNERQMFRLEPNISNNIFKRSCFIRNQYSEKMLEIRYMKNAQSIIVVQNKLNKRFSQRWIWERQGIGYLLKNVLSGFYLNVNENREVRIDKKNGEKSEFWIPDALGKNIFKIRSAFYPNFFLRVKNASLEDEQIIQLSDEMNKSSYWIIQGSLP